MARGRPTGKNNAVRQMTIELDDGQVVSAFSALMRAAMHTYMLLDDVYLTKDHLRAAFDASIGTQRQNEERKHAHNHPVDYHLRGWLREGKVFQDGVNKYMFAAASLDASGLTNERIAFETRRAAYDEIKYSTENKAAWARIETMVQEFLLVDPAWVDRMAKNFGMNTHKGTLTQQKMNSWVKRGLMTKLERGLYRLNRWDDGGKPDGALQEPLNNWIYEFIRVHSFVQFTKPETLFGGEQVSEFFMSNNFYSVDHDWIDSRKTIMKDFDYLNRTLSKHCVDILKTDNYDPVEQKPLPVSKKLFLRIRKGRYQIDPRILREWFRYDIQEDVEVQANAVADWLFLRSSYVLPEWFLIEDIPYILNNHRLSTMGPTRILRKLLDTKRVEYIEDANQIQWRDEYQKNQQNADAYGYRPAPIYRLSEQEFERRVGEMPRWTHKDNPFPNVRRLEDDWPVRNLPLPWWESDHYQAAISFYTSLYDKTLGGGKVKGITEADLRARGIDPKDWQT